ncbi:MAG: cytidine deaminase [Clostridia bacterium]|nr:cytidine deaminase [Clostridia bacterium]MBO7156498.1 cytidine deaminase [Clostridia bacterium]
MYKDLMETAVKAREFAYAPYSNYMVGAALLGKSGKVYTGCNVENATYTPTNCAERTAFFKAISEGEKEFEAIAIVAAKRGDALSKSCTPCGVCRQVMVEFCTKDFKIILGSPEDYKVYDLEEMIPYSFTSDEL